MNPIRTFVISSSMLLGIWLAASYVTRLDQAPPPPGDAPAQTAHTGTPATQAR